MKSAPTARSPRATTARNSNRYVLVGLGGIGGLVLRLLVPFLHSQRGRSTVVGIDGDRFEEHNRARMLFERPGMKAEVLAAEIAALYGDRVNLLPVPHYLTARNARTLIAEGDIVFCQPDNHATRRIVEQRCRRLRDASLFSGGNDGIEHGKTGTFGNVQVYLRARGRDRTNPLSRFHPEIAHPTDRVPGELGCAAAAQRGAPQLLFTNAAVAAAMLAAFHAWRGNALEYEEVYLDILRGRAVPVRRTVAASVKRAGGRAA